MQSWRDWLVMADWLVMVGLCTILYLRESHLQTRHKGFEKKTIHALRMVLCPGAFRQPVSRGINIHYAVLDECILRILVSFEDP